MSEMTFPFAIATKLLKYTGIKTARNRLNFYEVKL